MRLIILVEGRMIQYHKTFEKDFQTETVRTLNLGNSFILNVVLKELLFQGLSTILLSLKIFEFRSIELG